MDAISLSLLDIIAQNEQERLDYYAKCDQYYDGDHPLKVPEKYKQILEQEYGLIVNYCAPVVDAPVSRLTVDSLQCEDKATKEFLDGVWKKNKMDKKQIKIFRNAVKKGDAFVQVWPHFPMGSNKPDRYEIKFLRPDIVYPFYSSDDDESLEWVKKQWVAYIGGEAIARKDLFYPDRIERYFAGVTNPSMTMADFASAEWLPYTADGQPAVITNPYGRIPIIHFKNKEDDTPFGTSELQNAFTVQDGINKLIIDLVRTADFQAFKQRYVTGVEESELPVNPNTGKPELNCNPGEIWRFGGEGSEVTVGELTQNDPTGILSSIDKMVDHLCAVTRTPKTVLSDNDGTVASGFALSKIEAPLLNKVAECQVSFGDSFVDMNRLLLVMAKYHGESVNAESDVWANWKEVAADSPSDRLAESQRKQILKQNRVISSRQWALEEGYTAEEIERMQGELKSEDEAETASLIGHEYSNPTE